MPRRGARQALKRGLDLQLDLEELVEREPEGDLKTLGRRNVGLHRAALDRLLGQQAAGKDVQDLVRAPASASPASL